jgi:hypothetical protein
MADQENKININDLPANAALPKDEMKDVKGGLLPAVMPATTQQSQTSQTSQTASWGMSWGMIPTDQKAMPTDQ